MAGPLSRDTTGAHGIINDLFALFAVKSGYYAATLTGAISVDDTYPSMLGLDPGGAHRNVTLDAEATADGMFRLFVNKANAAENLVILDDAAATIATLNQDEAGLFHCNGTAWSLVILFTAPLA